ncbi:MULTISPECIES: helix-turn-helix domain-containing protein [Parabacteroides]|uniref:helix-turn-helix domain-containing protein n=1 Tax=Parabacteroides leei TaxID=2939491 RepID=UPI001E63E7A3|nr:MULTISPECIES: helix-turn-helix domain-containing protein [Parabacteroides]MCL3850961.1 helix-turn-helix domain-containing protein [Parabacteroides leei]
MIAASKSFNIRTLSLGIIPTNGIAVETVFPSKVVFIVSVEINVRNSNKSITQVAYSLGFQYTQHFVRFFKKYGSMTPSEYRCVSSSL